MAHEQAREPSATPAVENVVVGVARDNRARQPGIVHEAAVRTNAARIAHETQNIKVCAGCAAAVKETRLR